jgi:hypothetical protein
VPEGCPEQVTFEARLVALGTEAGGERLTIEVAPAWSGLYRGVVVIEAEGRERVERVIADEACADVVDALAITAALVLRAGLPEVPAPDPPPLPPDPPEVTPPPASAPPAPSGFPVRGWLGAGLRLGLGPTPDFSAALDVAGGLELDRLVVTLRGAFFPEAAALSPTGGGVALFALTGTLEVGGRIGDALALVPAAVLEVGAAVARGLDVARPRTEAAPTVDVGLALTGQAEVGALRFFLRLDLLLAAVRPAYLVGEGEVFQAPPVRGTGTLGLAWVVGP